MSKCMHERQGGSELGESECVHDSININVYIYTDMRLYADTCTYKRARITTQRYHTANF